MSSERKLKVFLCHSSGDKPAVRELYTRLQADGFDPWLDEEDILPGQDWRREIPKAVRSTEAIIVCLSHVSITKEGYVQTEIVEALDVADQKPEGTIFVIPLRLEDCEIPERLSRWQAGRLFAARGYEQLVQALTTRAAALGIAVSATNPSPSMIQDVVPPPQSNPRRETEPPLPPDPPPRVPPLPQPEKRSWLSWFSLPRVRVALSLSVSFVAVLVAVVSLFPRQDKQTLDIPSTTGESPPSKTEKKPSDSKEMIAIPAGEFWMGCNEKTDTQCENDEKPGRTVHLDAYAVDTYEVTVAEYRRCVEAGDCSDESLTNYASCNWGKEDKDNHPINCVDWDQAHTYCRWVGKRLPTEAEWEKAARGKEDRRIYPWEDRWDAKNANANNSGTVAVGSYAAGVSPYGVHDMAGNVWEWVQDWYDADYYKRGEGVERNPRGPDNGTARVLRGGSWRNEAWDVRVARRGRYEPGNWRDVLGFRCAQ